MLNEEGAGLCCRVRADRGVIACQSQIEPMSAMAKAHVEPLHFPGCRTSLLTSIPVATRCIRSTVPAMVARCWPGPAWAGARAARAQTLTSP